MSDYVKFEKTHSKFETIAKIEELLEESGLYWSCTYVPSADSYCIYIADRCAYIDGEPEELKGDVSDDRT